MSTQLQESPIEFDWQRQPATAALIAELVDRCIRANPYIAQLARRLHDETGTRLVDWVDSLDLPDSPEIRRELDDVGYERDPEEQNVWRQSDGLFPAVRLIHGLDEHRSALHSDCTPACLVVKAESVDDFIAAIAGAGQWHLVGDAGSQYRHAELAADYETTLAVAERHGWRRFASPGNAARQIASAAKHRQAFAKRRREFANNAEGFQQAHVIFDAAAADLGRDWACDLFFAEEREYWMGRNHAGRVQFERQDRLGLGWGNHDHHTFRSSRSAFASLVAALVHMGFHRRERFYAGREAGWGAQVLEHSICGFAVFADVDLSPEELTGDFTTEPLAERDKLGSVSLWCALHGEAFLEAGMHHLEAQFDFKAATQQLEALGVEILAPFTNWSYLRQAFTKGEMWKVRPEKIDAVLAAGHITAQQAEQFRRDGAIGSHLEILERNDGFKGFNQTGVSDIITRTDPRKW
jgi:hypothetical protein